MGLEAKTLGSSEWPSLIPALLKPPSYIWQLQLTLEQWPGLTTYLWFFEETLIWPKHWVCQYLGSHHQEFIWFEFRCFSILLEGLTAQNSPHKCCSFTNSTCNFCNKRLQMWRCNNSKFLYGHTHGLLSRVFHHVLLWLDV